MQMPTMADASSSLPSPATGIDPDENDTTESSTVSSASGPIHHVDLSPTTDAGQPTATASSSTTRPAAAAAAAATLVAPSTTIYCTTGNASPHHLHHHHHHHSHQYAYNSTHDPYIDGQAHASAGKETWSPRTPGKLAQILASQLPPLHEPRYHHAAAMFASLILTSTLALCSGLDAYIRCGSKGSEMYFSEVTDDDNAAVAEAVGDDQYNDDEEREEEEEDGDNGGDNRWRRWLEDAAGDDDQADGNDDDAVEQEQQDEFEDYYSNDDDDVQGADWYDEAQSCDETFKTILVPATVVGAAAGLIALCIVAFPRKKSKSGTTASVGTPGNPKDDYSGAPMNKVEEETGSYSGSDPVRRLKSRRRHLFQCLQLLLLSCLALAAWVYCIVFLMLEPRGGYNDNYRSLAAVDGWGRVGDNANLYYSTWASLGLSVSMVYELAGMTLLQWRSTRQAAAEVRARDHLHPRRFAGAAPAAAAANSRTCPPACHCVGSSASVDSYYESESTKAIETVLDWSTAQVEDKIRDSRTTWYNSLYKLRARTGIWVATLIASLIVCASSTRMWRNIVVPAAESLRGRSYYDWYGSTEVCDVFYVMDAAIDFTGGDDGNNEEEVSADGVDDNGGSRLWSGYDTNGVTYDTCTRTELAGTAGFVVSILSAVAILAHSFMRRHAAAVAASVDPTKHSVNGRTLTPCGSILPLPAELGLSMLNSLVLGSSAIFVTGVKGPAQSVGNLYYSVWLAFLLSLRITVACLEQMFNVDDEEEMMREQAHPGGSSIMACGTAHVESEGTNPSMRFKVPDEYNDALKKQVVTKVNNTRYDSMPDTSILETTDSLEENKSTVRAIDPKDRPKRLRRWGSIAVFSTVCAASAWDAAQNEAFGVTPAQKYMFILPMSVASLCYIVFLMCLHDVAYIFVDDFKIGGTAAIITFHAWLSNIVVTMHANSSFAVNSIGEIKFANLYYFSWASIIVAGIQMKTYTTKRLGVRPKSLVVIMWFAIVKVTFVMFGAGLHIWLNIADTCKTKNGEWQNELLSFCNRTAFSVIVGAAGTVIAFFVMACRVIRQITRTQLYIEMCLSGLFVLVFGLAAAVITSIGGPGQSVGDLYYATWLSFLVSIGVCISCYDELLRNAIIRKRSTSKQSPLVIEIPETTRSTDPSTPFQRMEDR